MSFPPGLRLPSVPCATPDGAVGDDGSLVVRLQGPVGAHDVARLCEQVRALLAAGDVRRVVCEVHDPVDLSVVEALARLQLTARRQGRQVRLRAVGARAGELLGLCGLTGVVPPESEPGGQPEAREQGGVQEVVDVPHLAL
jgi:ABC-type transporter Mla MlaB component